MASRAAMLLDPRAYKKQIEANGNDQEPHSFSHSCKSDMAGRACSEPPASYSDFLAPDPHDDPASSHPEDHSGSLRQGLKQQDATRAGGASPVAAPAGTFSTAHQLLNPRSQSTSSRTGPKSGSRSSSIPPQPAKNDVLSAKDESQPRRDVDVEFINGDFPNGEEGETKTKRPREDDSPGGGHVSLIENMYGVERREDQPQKRVKTAKEVEEKFLTRMKSQFEISGNGGLGDWMKEGKETPGTTPDVVDLTSGKDDIRYLDDVGLSLLMSTQTLVPSLHPEKKMMTCKSSDRMT